MYKIFVHEVFYSVMLIFYYFRMFDTAYPVPWVLGGRGLSQRGCNSHHFITGLIYGVRQHTHIQPRTFRQFRATGSPNLHVFVLWSKQECPEEPSAKAPAHLCTKRSNMPMLYRYFTVKYGTWVLLQLHCASPGQVTNTGSETSVQILTVEKAVFVGLRK